MEDSTISEAEAPKVHFHEEQLPEHESEIIVRGEAGDSIAVHLGFLQIYHHYEIQFSFEDSLGEDLSSDPLQNLHVKVMDVKPTEDGLGHEVLLEMTAHKEKLLREKIVLFDEHDKEKTINLNIHARVLGKGKGTPALKNGIRCSGIDVDMDSEANSDWQGFD